jgi:hypothetical protein
MTELMHTAAAGESRLPGRPSALRMSCSCVQTSKVRNSIAAAARKIDDGLGGLGEGFDEVVQMLRRFLLWRHAVSLLRLWT